ncbi:MAG TPA: single-stranded DNA-binding protein [Actinomycetota bacterium]|nr:single-stranded DNA-binding protein [Actinomycetota bacterium]
MRVVMDMAAGNQVVITGNLVDDPELRYTPNGAAVATLRVAVNHRYQDASGQWKDGETSYFRINAWRTLGENAAESLAKGFRVMVVGRLKQRSWETQDGQTRNTVEIEADEIGPSLKWATAKVEKTAPSGGGGGGDWSENVSVGAGGGLGESPLEAS